MVPDSEIRSPVHSVKLAAAGEGPPALHGSSLPHTYFTVKVHSLKHSGHTLDSQDVNVSIKPSKKPGNFLSVYTLLIH